MDNNINCFKCPVKKQNNPFCANCKEKDCKIDFSNKCELIRKYLKAVRGAE